MDYIEIYSNSANRRIVATHPMVRGVLNELVGNILIALENEITSGKRNSRFGLAATEIFGPSNGFLPSENIRDIFNLQLNLSVKYINEIGWNLYKIIHRIFGGFKVYLQFTSRPDITMGDLVIIRKIDVRFNYLWQHYFLKKTLPPLPRRQEKFPVSFDLENHFIEWSRITKSTKLHLLPPAISGILSFLQINAARTMENFEIIQENGPTMAAFLPIMMSGENLETMEMHKHLNFVFGTQTTDDVSNYFDNAIKLVAFRIFGSLSESVKRTHLIKMESQQRILQREIDQYPPSDGSYRMLTPVEKELLAVQKKIDAIKNNLLPLTVNENDVNDVVTQKLFQWMM